MDRSIKKKERELRRERVHAILTNTKREREMKELRIIIIRLELISSRVVGREKKTERHLMMMMMMRNKNLPPTLKPKGKK